MADERQVKKARKRARLALKEARSRLDKYGHTLDPARKAEVEAAADALDAAQAAGGVKSIYDALKTLDEKMEAHMAGVGKSQLREYTESIGLAIVIALLLRAFIIEAFTIPSGSMIPTLAVGDFLFVNKLSYGVRMPFTNNLIAEWDQPERGDVVVFVYPCNPSQDFIKRVVATPGDVVDITGPQRPGFYSSGSIVVNGAPVQERGAGVFGDYQQYSGPEEQMRGPFYAYANTVGERAFTTLHRVEFDAEQQLMGRRGGMPVNDWSKHAQKNFCRQPGDTVNAAQPLPPFPWKIPEGYVMVMGDNRDNSSDSRVWGLVPMGNIKGRALFIWLSWDSIQPWSEFWNKIRWGRLGQAVHQDPDDA